MGEDYIGQLVEARVVFQPEKRTAEASQQNLLQPQEKKDSWVDAIVIGVHGEKKTIDVVVLNAKTVGVLPLAFHVNADDTRLSRKILEIKLPEDLKTIEEAKNSPETMPEVEPVEIDIKEAIEFEEDKSEGGADVSEEKSE